MAIPLTKLTIVIGAGLVGSALSTEGSLWDVGNFISGAFKVVTKNLNNVKDKSPSTGKPPTNSLLLEVNTLRDQLQKLAHDKSVTIITGRQSGSGTYTIVAIIAVGAVGYGYIRWKGWKLSDMMFVTKRGFSDACNTIGKDVDGLQTSITTTQQEVGSRIDNTENSIDEITAQSVHTKDEVKKLEGEMKQIQDKAGSVFKAVQTLEEKLQTIDSKQEVNNIGIEELVNYVKHSMEKGRSQDFIQSSQAGSSRKAIEHQKSAPVLRTTSQPVTIVELPPSPSLSPCPSPKIFHANSLSSGLNLHEAVRNPGFSAPTTAEEPSSASSSSRYWPGTSIFNRVRSTLN